MTPTVLNGSTTQFTATLSSSGFWEALVNGTVATNGTGTSASYNYSAVSVGDKNITIRTDDDQQTWILTVYDSTIDEIIGFINVEAVEIVAVITTVVGGSFVGRWYRRKKKG